MDEIGKDVLFGKRMFGGFSRRDVIRYIDTLQKQNLNAAQSGEDALRQAQAQVQTLTAQLHEANARIEALETQLRMREEPRAEEEPASSPEPGSPAQPAASAPAAQSSSFAQTPGNAAKKSSLFSRKERASGKFF